MLRGLFTKKDWINLLKRDLDNCFDLKLAMLSVFNKSILPMFTQKPFYVVCMLSEEA